MAVNNWLSRALARAQLETITIANTWATNDIANVTINGKTVSFTATAGTVANVTTGLLAALVASTIVEFTEITWASSGAGTITGTSITAGVPFTLTTSETTAGDGTVTRATTTAATGPNHWDDVNNWSAGTIPADTEDVNVDLSRGSIYYGLPQSAIEPATLLIYSPARTQNTLGLPRQNALGYTEYRATKLLIGPAACTIDTDSPRVIVDFGTDQVACVVLRSGQGSSDGTTPATLLCGNNVANTWEVVQGSVGFAMFDDEVVTGTTMQLNSQAVVRAGTGCNVTTVTSAGQTDYRGTATSLTSNGNLTTVRGSTAFTNLTAEGGDIDYRSSGTVTNASAGGRRAGTIDCSQDLTGRTFTNTTLKRNGTINDPNRTITYTNKVTIDSTVSQVTAA
jgi:hypothetical protein